MFTVLSIHYTPRGCQEEEKESDPEDVYRKKGHY